MVIVFGSHISDNTTPLIYFICCTNVRFWWPIFSLYNARKQAATKLPSASIISGSKANSLASKCNIQWPSSAIPFVSWHFYIQNPLFVSSFNPNPSFSWSAPSSSISFLRLLLVFWNNTLPAPWHLGLANHCLGPFFKRRHTEKKKVHDRITFRTLLKEPRNVRLISGEIWLKTVRERFN